MLELMEKPALTLAYKAGLWMDDQDWGHGKDFLPFFESLLNLHLLYNIWSSFSLHANVIYGTLRGFFLIAKKSKIIICNSKQTGILKSDKLNVFFFLE